MKHLAPSAWPLKARFIPAFGQLEYSGPHVIAGMHHGCMSQEISQHAAAFGLEFKAAVGQYRVDFVTDLIHMRDHSDGGFLCIGLLAGRATPMKDEVAGIVGFRLGPGGKQLADGFAHVLLMAAAHTVGFNQSFEDGFR